MLCWEPGAAPFIEELFTLSWGEGHASHMLGALLTLTGAETIELQVDKRNTRAMRFYERLGWRRVRWWERARSW